MWQRAGGVGGGRGGRGNIVPVRSLPARRAGSCGPAASTGAAG